MTQVEAQHSCIALNRQRGEQQGEVVVCGHLAIAGHVPSRGHDDTASQGILEARDIADCEVKRLWIQANLCVGQILVVNKDEIGACDSLSFFDNGRGAINIKFLAENARDCSLFVCAVAGNDQAVRTKRRPLREGLLKHSKLGDRPVIVDLNFGAKQSDASFFQPDSRPLLEIATRGLLEFVKKICQGGVLVGVLGQVFMQARKEVLATDIAD